MGQYKTSDELIKIFNACPSHTPHNAEQFVRDNARYGYLFIKRTPKAHYELDESGMFSVEKCAGVWVHCSRCGNTEFIPDAQDRYKHKQHTECPCCDAPVTVYDLKYSHKSVRIQNNYAYLKVLNENEAYISCYFADFDYSGADVTEPDFTLQECERYYLTPGYSVRWKFGASRPNGWHGDYNRYVYQSTDKIIATYGEPFCFNTMGYGYTHEGYCYNFSEASNCFLRYSAYQIYESISGGTVDTPYGEAYQDGVSIVKYLQHYCTEPVLEKLLKVGYKKLCFNAVEWNRAVSRRDINFKASTLKGFFRNRLAKAEIKAAVDWNAAQIIAYISMRDMFCKTHPEKPKQKLIECAEVFADKLSRHWKSLRELQGVDLYEAIKYLDKSDNIKHVGDYVDYIDNCNYLKLDLSDTSVAFPKQLMSAHDRAAEMAENERDKEKNKALKTKMYKRYEYLKNFVFSYGPEYIIRVPEIASEIKTEGAKLSHCVGGYAERHAEGTTNILFVRKCSDYDTPYYTLEMRNNGTIVQCRGYKNNVISSGGKEKPQEMIEFEKAFEKFAIKKVVELKRKKEKERIKAKTKQKQRVRIGA